MRAFPANISYKAFPQPILCKSEPIHRIMKIKQILFVTAAGVMLAACQSNTYKISGKVEGLQDGDTLLITKDLRTGKPSDTLIVKDGTFTLQGEVDSVQLAMIYSLKNQEINAPFFLEPGSITISLSETPGSSRVGGTKCNSEWQILNDSVMTIGKEINRIAEHIYGNTVTPEQQEKGMQQIDQLNERFAKLVVKSAENNSGNEFGYFLLTYYPEELIDNASRAKLIKQLPAERRSRKAIKDLQEQINRASKTAAGNPLPAFSQTTPEGTELDIMTEVKKNKVTIIDFWASWCGPCRQEMPFMIDLYQKYKDQGLGIVGVSLDNDREAWVQAIAALKLEWPQMSDLKGWENAAAQLFNITSIPHTIVVDQQGKILQHGLRGEALKTFVEEQLK